MKTLIIGSDGQLGSQLMEFMPNPTGGASRKGKDSMRLDISDVHEVENLILSEKPDVVVNAAAITDVDLCEREREMALKVNGIAVRSMARACSVIGSYFIHISTDYVFDGEKGMYKEDDAPNPPLNYYGISKLYGEASALAYDETLVVRTSGVFGYKQNFPLFVLKTLQGNGTVKCIDSFYSPPIHARLLARAIAELLGRRLRDNQRIRCKDIQIRACHENQGILRHRYGHCGAAAGGAVWYREREAPSRFLVGQLQGQGTTVLRLRVC